MPGSYKNYTDPELVAHCLKGEAGAWEALIVRYRRLIYSIPVRFGFSSTDASDIFQAVCLKLIEHLHELKDETKVSAWIITTTARQCIHLRSQRFREPGTEGDLEEAADSTKSFDEIRVEIEEQQALRDSVQLLPRRCQHLIELLYFDPRSPSYEEISQSLEIPVPSIGPTRARCLEKLRMILRRRGIK